MDLLIEACSCLHETTETANNLINSTHFLVAFVQADNDDYDDDDDVDDDDDDNDDDDEAGAANNLINSTHSLLALTLRLLSVIITFPRTTMPPASHASINYQQKLP